MAPTEDPADDRDDDTVVSSRPRERAPDTPAAGILGPTAVSAHDDADDTDPGRGRSRMPAPAPASPSTARKAVVPDAASLRSPHPARADDAIRVARGAAPQPPSGGAPVAGDEVNRAVRARAVRRAVIAATVAVAAIAAAVVGLVLILG